MVWEMGQHWHIDAALQKKIHGIQRIGRVLCQQSNDLRMKFLFFTLLIATAFFACSKKNDVAELPASIQAIIDSTENCVCDPIIYQYRWLFEKVYVSTCSGPLCNCFSHYFDSEGNLMTTDQGYDFSGFQEKAKLERVVWECGQ